MVPYVEYIKRNWYKLSPKFNTSQTKFSVLSLGAPTSLAGPALPGYPHVCYRTIHFDYTAFVHKILQKNMTYFEIL